MNYYEMVDALLAVAERLVGELRESNNDDMTSYGLLMSVADHIAAARFDLDADLK